MSRRHVDALHGRLSLRAPQRDALELLARVADALPLTKGADPAAALAAVRAEAAALAAERQARGAYDGFRQVEEFERDFPSLCFALATGVGKTRLMGAFIAYLHLARGLRHFFVLAPNLTIYEKLIRDFTPGTPKYVFQGIAEFAQDPPELITGDDYEGGRGVRGGDLFADRAVHVNVFNISKINAEVRGGAAPRIKRLSEWIGESCFAYLAGLPDLVLLMDESHRYRAASGLRAINELRPVLGLELTATPFVEQGARRQVFRNVAYEYPLARAIRDGYVKEPAVATRENFVAADWDEARLERLKLEDGVRLHEATKVELETHARQRGVPAVKPFVLVIARDTEHAAAIERTVRGADFFDGRYAGRVITVHSNQRGEERDDMVARLLQVEHADEPTEIVIHVNMLKEGWDVTNLYTIVPLRAANARTLVEQSIGRGLRFPYGRRTGVKAVDRLTIVAHDRFEEIVDEAQRGDSVIRLEVVVVGRDVPDARQETVTIAPLAEAPVTAAPAERAIEAAARETLREFEYLPRSTALRDPAVHAQVVRRVMERLVAAPADGAAPLLPGLDDGAANAPAAAEVSRIVEQVRERRIAHTIDVPRVLVVPTGEVTCGFHDFDLDLGDLRLQPVDQAILVQALASGERTRVAGATAVAEARLEDHLVRALVDFDDVSYDEHAELLYKLAGQAVAHLRSYLPDDAAVENVLRAHERQLAALVHAQMAAHWWQAATGYEARVSRGFTTLRPMTRTVTAGEAPRDHRLPVDARRDIRRMRFAGFARCLFAEQRFDSDAERRLAGILEREDGDDPVERWVKPGPGVLRIDHAAGEAYEPDFVIETRARKYLCEVKAADALLDPEVQAKARAAALWCRHASDHEGAHGGKPWRYLLVPDDRIVPNATLAGLAAAHGVLG